MVTTRIERTGMIRDGAPTGQHPEQCTGEAWTPLLLACRIMSHLHHSYCKLKMAPSCILAALLCQPECHVLPTMQEVALVSPCCGASANFCVFSSHSFLCCTCKCSNKRF